ncbi:MAG TPA: hypothetical protein VHF69_00515, partial [Candidatus Synoicihabitans sp.]|nr:hypothetical protein [Candidatus Synoicihabitans sp.]
MDVLASVEDIRQQRRVVGIYLGWRGASLMGKANSLTLWNRKNVAEHIGRTGAKEVLFDLHQEWFNRRDDARKVRMITVGHSLGGAMIFSAVKGKMSGNADDIVHPGRAGTFRITRAEQSRDDARGQDTKARRARFGDLVVLVNPAIEAAEYEAFDEDLAGSGDREIVDRDLPFPNDQLPILMTVASTADTAVGRLFPAARWLSFLNVARNGEVIRRRSERVGMGRYAAHITHRLEFGRKADSGEIAPKPRGKMTSEKPAGCECTKEWGGTPVPVPERDSALPLDTLADQEWSAPDGNVMRFGLSPERKRRGWDLRSPYVVVSADPGVINEHSDI